MAPLTPLELYLDQLSKTEPLLRLREDQSLEEWRVLARQKLRELLGMDQVVPCELDFHAEEPVDKGDYTRTRFTFQSEPGFRVPGYFLRPKTVGATSATAPAITCRASADGSTWAAWRGSSRRAPLWWWLG